MGTPVTSACICIQSRLLVAPPQAAMRVTSKPPSTVHWSGRTPSVWAPKKPLPWTSAADWPVRTRAGGANRSGRPAPDGRRGQAPPGPAGCWDQPSSSQMAAGMSRSTRSRT